MLDKKLREHLSNGGIIIYLAVVCMHSGLWYHLVLGNMGDLHNGNSVMVSSKKPANSFQNTEKQSPKKGQGLYVMVNIHSQ